MKPITALVTVLLALGCGSERTPARGPQTPELPTARRTAPLEQGSGESAAGFTGPVPAPGTVAPAPRSSLLPAARLPEGQEATPRTCPMSLTGAQVSVIELPSGGALEFSAAGATEADLLEAVGAQAEAYVRRVSLQNGVPLYRVRQEGTRIVFEPTNPEQLDALRDDLIEHAAIMQGTRSCPVS